MQSGKNCVKVLALEVKALLMLTHRQEFSQNLEMFLKWIEQDRPEPSKSVVFGVILQTLFDAVIVYSLFTTRQASPEDQLILKLRSLLMQQLRDADVNVRYIATEGFSRILMCESTDKFADYIARLLLLLFEKAPSLMSEQQEQLLSPSVADPGFLRTTIE